MTQGEAICRSDLDLLDGAFCRAVERLDPCMGGLLS